MIQYMHSCRLILRNKCIVCSGLVSQKHACICCHHDTPAPSRSTFSSLNSNGVIVLSNFLHSAIVSCLETKFLSPAINKAYQLPNQQLYICPLHINYYSSKYFQVLLFLFPVSVFFLFCMLNSAFCFYTLVFYWTVSFDMDICLLAQLFINHCGFKKHIILGILKYLCCYNLSSVQLLLTEITAISSHL